MSYTLRTHIRPPGQHSWAYYYDNKVYKQTQR